MKKSKITAYLALKLPKPIRFEIIIFAFPMMSLHGAIMAGSKYIVNKILAGLEKTKLEKTLGSYIGKSGSLEFIYLISQTMCGHVAISASRYGNTEIIAKILENNTLSRAYEVACVIEAIKAHHLNVIKLFDVRDSADGYLTSAFIRGNPAILKHFMCYGKGGTFIPSENYMLSKQHSKYDTGIFSDWALYHNNKKVLKHLDVLSEDQINYCFAIEGGHLELVKKLIKGHKSDVYQFDLMAAVECGRLDMVAVILPIVSFKAYLVDCVKKAIELGFFDIAHLILQHVGVPREKAFFLF